MRITIKMLGLFVLLTIGSRIEGRTCLLPVPVDSLSRVDIFFQQANIHLLNRNWDRAITLYQQALQEVYIPVQRSRIHQNLGCLFFLLTDYEHTVIHFEYSYSLLMNQPDADGDRLAEICMNLASTYYEMNEPDKSLFWWNQLRKSIRGNAELWSLRCALGSGNVHFQLGEYRHALSEYSIPIRNLSYEDKPTGEEIWIRKNMALCLRELGQLDSAMLCFRKTIERINVSDGEFIWLIPELLFLQGDLCLKTDHSRIALDLFEQGLARIESSSLKQSYPEMEQRRFTTAELTRHKLLCGIVTANDQLLKGFEPDPLLREDLLQEIFQAVELGELLRETEYLGDILSTEPDAQLNMYNLAMELLFQADKASYQHQQKMLEIAERQRKFHEEIGDGGDWEEGIQPDMDLYRFHNLKRQSFQLHKQYLATDPARFPTNLDFPEKRFIVRSELDSLNRKLKKESKDTGIPLSFVPDIRDIFSLLFDDEAILEFMVTDSALFSFFISPDTCLFTRTQLDEVFLQDVQRFVVALKRADFKGFNKLSNRLYHQLISPFQHILKERTKLLIIPGRELTRLPFEVLAENRTFLINKHEICYHLSVTSWYHDRLYGRSGHNQESPDYRYDFIGCAPDFSTASQLVRLPYSSSEVDTIIEMFQQAGQNTCKMNTEAFGEKSFFNTAGLSRIVHLASHGLRDRENPELSGWILAPDPAPSPSDHLVDGRLDMGELQSFRLQSDLIVFSTCSIGSKTDKTWYRITGFPRNFLKAGVNHILFSLWNVSDKHTRQFMLTFYRHILAGKSYPAALRQAKIKMLESPETAIPTIWAPFVLWSN